MHLLPCLFLQLLAVGYVLAAVTPQAIFSYEGLLQVGAVADDYGTGDRFTKEVLLLFHADACTPEIKLTRLEELVSRSHVFVIASANVEASSKDLLDAFSVPNDVSELTCPHVVVIHQRSLAAKPEWQAVPRPASGLEQNLAVNVATETQEVAVAVVNDYDFDVDVYQRIWWGDGRWTRHASLQMMEPGAERWVTVVRTTELMVTKAGEKEELQVYVAHGNGLFTASARDCDAENCGLTERPEKVVQERKIPVKAEKLAELPTFTEMGFKKVKVPDEPWDIIMSYYEANKAVPKLERWANGNIVTNDKEAPTYMVPLPEIGPLKPRVFNGIKPILEEWSGHELEQTACYGVRIYTKGSWLATHVDRRSTHAVSVIVNVDQDVQEPWELVIFDHAGHQHNITMAPRDMVLYESATCTHGRPHTLDGKFYANTFIHYRYLRTYA
ncbi:unnamed protein product [Chrysoparadoxa australica]